MKVSLFSLLKRGQPDQSIMRIAVSSSCRSSGKIGSGNKSNFFRSEIEKWNWIHYWRAFMESNEITHVGSGPISNPFKIYDRLTKVCSVGLLPIYSEWVFTRFSKECTVSDKSARSERCAGRNSRSCLHLGDPRRGALRRARSSYSWETIYLYIT